MATVSIYVSADLKAVMEQHDINWSRIAQEAFERAIEKDALWAGRVLNPDFEPPLLLRSLAGLTTHPPP